MNYLRKPAMYLSAAVLAASFLTGCKDTRTELSDVIHEDAKVAKMEHHSSYITLVPMRVGKVTIMNQIHHPERNNITFKGKLKFEVDNKKIYKRVKLGDKADVSYRESYKLTFEDLNKDGKKEQISREFSDYVFVDAQPKEDTPAK